MSKKLEKTGYTKMAEEMKKGTYKYTGDLMRENQDKILEKGVGRMRFPISENSNEHSNIVGFIEINDEKIATMFKEGFLEINTTRIETTRELVDLSFCISTKELVE